MDTKKKELDFDFQSWIKEQHNDDYQIVEDNESLIKLVTDYGEASIRFTVIVQL